MEQKMIAKAIQLISDNLELSEDQAFQVMDEIMTGEASEIQIAALLTGLRVRGEAVAEVLGFARSMRANARQVHMDDCFLVDPVGTGGDGTGTFNISSAAALVASAAGAIVAKHGNRSVSSRCGSADVFEALGLNIMLEPQAVERCIRESRFGFLFAPIFHPAMKFAAPVRRQLGIRTLFNLLGPLVNPASIQGQLLGMYNVELLPLIANVIRDLGVVRALVVHGSDHSDEITLTGATSVCELRDGLISEYTIHPEDFGLSCCDAAALQGGTPAENALLIIAILEGQPGPARDVVLLNAGATLYVAGVADSIRAGVAAAAEAIDSGKARAQLETLRRITQELGCCA